MTDEQPRSNLAQKALAQKALRERQAQEAADREAAAKRHAEMVFTTWGQIRQELLSSCNDINAELTGTGTSISPNKEPDNPKGPLLGDYTITVVREGVSDRSQTFTLRFSKVGTMSIYEAFGTAGPRGEHVFEAEEIESGSVNALLRSYMDKALS